MEEQIKAVVFVWSRHGKKRGSDRVVFPYFNPEYMRPSMLRRTSRLCGRGGCWGEVKTCSLILMILRIFLANLQTHKADKERGNEQGKQKYVDVAPRTV